MAIIGKSHHILGGWFFASSSFCVSDSFVSPILLRPFRSKTSDRLGFKALSVTRCEKSSPLSRAATSHAIFTCPRLPRSTVICIVSHRPLPSCQAVFRKCTGGHFESSQLFGISSLRRASQRHVICSARDAGVVIIPGLLRCFFRREEEDRTPKSPRI